MITEPNYFEAKGPTREIAAFESDICLLDPFGTRTHATETPTGSPSSAYLLTLNFAKSCSLANTQFLLPSKVRHRLTILSVSSQIAATVIPAHLLVTQGYANTRLDSVSSYVATNHPIETFLLQSLLVASFHFDFSRGLWCTVSLIHSSHIAFSLTPDLSAALVATSFSVSVLPPSLENGATADLIQSQARFNASLLAGPSSFAPPSSPLAQSVIVDSHAVHASALWASVGLPATDRLATAAAPPTVLFVFSFQSESATLTDSRFFTASHGVGFSAGLNSSVSLFFSAVLAATALVRSYPLAASAFVSLTNVFGKSLPASSINFAATALAGGTAIIDASEDLADSPSGGWGTVPLAVSVAAAESVPGTFSFQLLLSPPIRPSIASARSRGLAGSAVLGGSAISGDSRGFGGTALLCTAVLSGSVSFGQTQSIGKWELPAAVDSPGYLILGLELWLFLVIVGAILLIAVIAIGCFLRAGARVSDFQDEAGVAGKSLPFNLNEGLGHDFVNPLDDDDELGEIASDPSFSPSSMDEGAPA
jgi:hypothetical protein